MIYKQNLTLDIYQQHQFQYINAVQFDHNARQLVITPTANGEKITIPATASAVFRCLKQDGTSVINPATIDAEAGTVTCELTNQSLSCAGMTRADISIIDGVDIVSTLTFFIMVETAPVSNEHIESTDEFLFIIEMADKVQEQATAAEKAANDAKASEENAAASATAAADSASASATSETNASASESNASASASSAAASASDAAAAKTAAETAKTAAETAKAEAQTAATDASGSKTAAEQSAAAAAQSAESAAQSASSASENATAAQQSKEAAATSEANALASKNSAAESAAAALERKNSAAASQAAAATSETNAAASATAAQAAQAAAEKARDQAQSIVGGDYANITPIIIPAGRMRGDVDGDGKFTQDDVDLFNNGPTSVDSISKYPNVIFSKAFPDGDVPLDFLTADVTNDSKLSSMDVLQIKLLMNGTRKAGSITEVTGNWTNNPNYDTEEGQFYTDIAISGMTANHSASVIVKGTYESGFFTKAECISGAIRIYAKLCPISALTAVVSWGSGNGTAVITTESEDLTEYAEHVADATIHLPAVTTDDNGKILQVVDGVWTAVTPS